MTTATHSGMVRSHNEDSIGADASIGLAVLADGMGGYNAGEVASGIAV
ncbi:MAG: protein phosphatase, partial [Betaproteobacteria bacterium]|nr:protein phosphatase [Betaproteobacteria bacterium]